MVKSEFISTRDEGKNMDKGNVVTVGSYLRRETKWKTQPLSQQKKRGIQAVCGHWPRYLLVGDVLNDALHPQNGSVGIPVGIVVVLVEPFYARMSRGLRIGQTVEDGLSGFNHLA